MKGLSRIYSTNPTSGVEVNARRWTNEEGLQEGESRKKAKPVAYFLEVGGQRKEPTSGGLVKAAGEHTVVYFTPNFGLAERSWPVAVSQLSAIQCSFGFDPNGRGGLGSTAHQAVCGGRKRIKYSVSKEKSGLPLGVATQGCRLPPFIFASNCCTAAS
jgi:hypothetical protein